MSNLETSEAQRGQQPDTNPDISVRPENLAYIIYTSGSTGQPKGVMNSHKAINNRLWWLQNTYPLTTDDIILQKTVFSFDASIWEIFLPLMVGSHLVLAEPDGQNDSDYLIDTIIDSQITILQGVPSFYRLLVANPRFKDCRSLKRLFTAGEALPMTLVDQLRDTLEADLINTYGPTEASIDVSYWPCHIDGEQNLEHVDKHLQIAPIGKPVANIQLYILDRQLQPVPVGVSGELHIGGIGLARGYWQRPSLTAEKFIPNPFVSMSNEQEKENGGQLAISSDPVSNEHFVNRQSKIVNGDRLYKTGDLARYLPDGTIEFLGRIDHQVKIRGYRMGLGEIEAALVKQPIVQEAVVIVRDDQSNTPQLVAYVVCKTSNEEEEQTAKELSFSTELQQLLKAQLPDYMIPRMYIQLERMPLTANGKVNRQALPAPSLKKPQAGYSPPQTPTERLVASIWEQVLSRQKIGVTDNFFELGGHSLLATQVIARLRSAFNLEVAIRALFEQPTVATLSHHIEALQLADQTLNKPPLLPANREADLPLSFAQQRLWFLEQLDGPNAAYNMPLALQLTGQLNHSALIEALQLIIDRHEVLRTRFIRVDGEPRQIIASALAVQLPIIDISSLSAIQQTKKVEQLAINETQTPFNLRTGPLIRGLLIQKSPEDSETPVHILLTTVHHIVADGWSMGILLEEFSQVYQALVLQQSPALPALPFQYTDYATWQRQWLQEEVLAQQLAYWETQLEAVPTLLNLPTDYPRPKTQSFRGQYKQITIASEVTDRLRRLSQAADVTLFMTIYAALATLLARHSGQQDIVIGTPIANRQNKDTESLIGFFINTLALRLDLSKDPSFEQLLKQARRVTLDGYTWQDIPFERLVEALPIERTLSHTPLFQVMLIWQNTPSTQSDIPGLTVTPLALNNTLEYTAPMAKFDLSLYLGPSETGLEGTLVYNADLFAPSTIERLLQHFEILLQGIITDPTQRLSQLPLLTQGEYLDIQAWNTTEAAYPRGQGIHHYFEAQVVRTPHATALIFEASSLTYDTLNKRANQVAHTLLSFGITPQTRIGLYVERSL
ncbi:MAG: amino acid adenylation domain-containing protein, partial [Chloroflexota bacterium]